MINQLLELEDTEAMAVARGLSLIMKIANDMAEEGSADAFRIYRTARDALELMSMDRISRMTLKKLADAGGQETFQGWPVTDAVKHFIGRGEKINAIKQFRHETGLDLKEAKDWVEAYAARPTF